MSATLQCGPDGNGGVMLAITAPQGTMQVPIGHEHAIAVAELLLRNAGVASAVFEDGRIAELA